MKDWRPIALCNVLYKLVSKVLANRLKRVLDKCISDNQSAFVPDRSILDNAMVAIEVVHFMKSKTRGKLGNVDLKLDISKAYDRIDWDHLKEVMIKMGFSHQWVKWVMMCVESVDYSVIVNDDMVGPIIPGRGLRQGDPLSPYLFIICAEGLSSLIKQAEAKGDIHGIKICKNAPIISHLLFADDCFLFFRADEHEAYIMKNILSTYEAASGQAISLPKSEIFCSRNVSQVVQNSITNILGVQAVLGTGKYLGLPSMVGRSKKQTFNYIKDRVWRKINSWSSKCLSKAGREVLIKSVLQAIPSYVMSIFLIPGSLINAIEKMMNSFWWGHGGSNNKGIHWLAWDKLSVHKNKGGMGFKDLTAFNIAMLSARWCIGSGENISILGEPWIQGGTPISASNPSVMHLQNIKVKHLISNTTKELDSHVINNLFDQGTADAILRTPLFQQVTSDKLVWKAEKKGNYTVKIAYRLCVEELLDTSHLSRPGFWSGIWRLKVPPKVKNLLWRICRGCFPTRARLRDKGIQCPSNCVVCDDNYEDTGHILFYCPLSIRAWQSIGLWEKVEAVVKTTTTAATSIFLLLQQLDEQQATHMAALMWSIWKHRNLKLWQDVTETSSQVVARAIKLIEDWINAHKAAARQQPEGTRSDNSNTYELRSINRSVQAPIRWRKPATGRYKCNIDASFSSHSNQVGIGICIRDDEGRYVLAKSMWLSPICNVDIGEALGLLHAIKWVSELQLDAVDFALDSKLLVDYFNKGGCDITEFGDIIGALGQTVTLQEPWELKSRAPLATSSLNLKPTSNMRSNKLQMLPVMGEQETTSLLLVQMLNSPAEEEEDEEAKGLENPVDLPAHSATILPLVKLRKKFGKSATQLSSLEQELNFQDNNPQSLAKTRANTASITKATAI
ncbi:unnamed protein product [Trifolium pratense]|uniref:Uncharacterized protein n=1 Tax=Trifolium pratense TaxID=57577 RepID=A0ACB0M3R6_TRIPR|nr:unnamed protein product [Trifolium pratense]